jgi:hypothetical protein
MEYLELRVLIRKTFDPHLCQAKISFQLLLRNTKFKRNQRKNKFLRTEVFIVLYFEKNSGDTVTLDSRPSPYKIDYKYSKSHNKLSKGQRIELILTRHATRSVEWTVNFHMVLTREIWWDTWQNTAPSSENFEKINDSKTRSKAWTGKILDQ